MKWMKGLVVGTNHRSLGDAARDKQDWPNAQQAYETHLQSHPDDSAIWVQLGHSRKEQGDNEGAEEAYRRAVKLQPSDADALLQLGRVLKSTGRLAEAKECLAASFQSDSTHAAYEELMTIPGDDTLGGWHASTVSPNTIYMEINDLFLYLHHHKTLSGIQRVQVNIIDYVLNSGDPAIKDNCLFVLNLPDSDTLWALRNGDLRAMLSYLGMPSVDHTRLRELISNCRQKAKAVSVEEGQCYFVLGAFWGSQGITARYVRLKKQGVTLGAYIYDIIPITNPEFCDNSLVREFSLCFGDGLALFDFTLGISEYTAQEIRRYQTQHKLLPKPVAAVRLAHAQSDAVSKPSAKPIWSGAIARFKERPFVLMVSTIEARKNHIYLVRAWKRMIEEGLDPPDLVLVGRFGWKVAELTDLLETTDYLDNRVHVLHDLSDAELETLYDGCLFTVFSSFVEGWGLPVGESLARGKPCVAARTSSIPEIGGDLVDYLDPDSLRDGTKVLQRMCFDADYRATRAAQIQKDLKLRHWKDVGNDLFAAIGKMRGLVPANRFKAVELEPGTFFRPKSLFHTQPIPRTYARRPDRLILAEGWHEIEPPGCWMKGSGATLSFRTPLEPATPVVVYFQGYCAPWAVSEQELLVRVGPSQRRADSTTATAPLSANAPLIVRATGLIDAQSILSIHLEIKGARVPFENENAGARQFVIGMSGIAYAPSADPILRLNMMEGLLMPTH